MYLTCGQSVCSRKLVSTPFDICSGWLSAYGFVLSTTMSILCHDHLFVYPKYLSNLDLHCPKMFASFYSGLAALLAWRSHWFWIVITLCSLHQQRPNQEFFGQIKLWSVVTFIHIVEVHLSSCFDHFVHSGMRSVLFFGCDI